MRRTVLITGAGGYVGRAVVQRLARQPDTFRVVAMDMRETPPELHVDGVAYVTGDVRAPDLAQTLREYDVDCVVHLASIVNPGKDQDRAFAWSVDVQGTENVVQACLATGVAQLIVSSSGAAYGYYADNPAWLCEDDPVRGNPEFAYADHKRQVEERLARTRETHPQLRQLVLRSGTVLGAETDNQITALFHKPFILGIAGADTPFVFIWDEDLADIIVRGIAEQATGIYNVAGDGVMTMRDIARAVQRPLVPVPAWLLRGVLAVLKALRATPYGPEQVNFLRYRPVLDNTRLKRTFGYTPRKTSREAFDFYLEHARRRGRA